MARDELEAEQRNEQLVSQLEESGTLRDPAVGAAFRAVLRHRFLPGRPLDEVYEDSVVLTKVGPQGVAVSSSSQPAIMVIMLQLLRLRPGHRVLEVGAGTGYNAALMAHLVAPGGHVVTVDIDSDLVDQARANLAAAGAEGVEVVHADGAGGWPPGAGFDRMMVTASADDVSPAWFDQLVEEGRLVLPLALAGPGQHCVAFVKRGRALVSDELCMCGFMQLRGEMAPAPAPVDEELAGWFAGPSRDGGHVVPAADLRAGFEVWLGLTEEGYVRPGAFGLRDDRGAALVVAGEDGEHRVVVFGDGDAAAARLIDAHRAWARHRPAPDRVAIVALPAGVPPPRGERLRMVRRPRFTFAVRPT